MKTILLTILLTISIAIKAQEAKYFAFNVVSSSLVSGIGSGFHKKTGETFGHAFLNGLWKGAAGGVIIYSGKELIRYSSNHNTYNYVWSARMLNALGSSMVYNGLNNDKILETVSMNVFFTNISFDGKMHVKVDPFTMASGVVLAFNDKLEFNLNNTLRAGSVVFDKPYTKTVETDYMATDELMGRNFGNCLYSRKFVMKESYGRVLKAHLKGIEMNIFLHELIHSFQYENSFYYDLKIKYLYINPFSDFNYQMNNLNGYKNNVYENEADYFANSKF